MYIWQRPNWPEFSWDAQRILEPLAIARHQQGLLLGRMAGLGFDLKLEAALATLTEDVIKSSEIEGEVLDRNSVRSSLARRLGIPTAGAPADRKADGIVDMMLDATQNYMTPLTRDRLFGWEAALFPTGYSGLHLVLTDAYRTDHEGPMQVVSGSVARQRVHYEAPPASRVEAEMERFLTWFNAKPTTDGLLRAALAHLWFVTIHPFEDGNGRIARAIADQVLAQVENVGQRFYSVSSQIREERSQYYDTLERTQKGDVDVTEWILWFLECFSHALDGAETITASVLKKADFWQRHAGEEFIDRQREMLNRYLEGFQGKLTAKKWATLTKVSPATAQRDINDLVERRILRRNSGGSKNTSYDVAEPRIESR